ncbi:MAG: hypothetical protein HOP19_10125 [Acidobacteria bacterium]|nr:hypothetical protein [Acidobacteriota bacterium]
MLSNTQPNHAETSARLSDAFTLAELEADPDLRAVTANDPVMTLLLTGQAATFAEAERKFLNENVDLITEQVIALANSNLSEDELYQFPLVMLLRGRAIRKWEDSFYSTRYLMLVEALRLRYERTQ